MSGDTKRKSGRYHKELEVWKRSMELVEEIYKLSSKFPKEEIYCLTTQLRRAVISVPTNIAEGAARRSKREFLQFLSISLGSLAELETELEIARRLNYVSTGDSMSLQEEISTIRKMILGLMRKVKSNE